MKILFYIIISLLILEGCGKKSDPKSQGKIKHEIKASS